MEVHKQFVPSEESVHQPDNFRTRRVYDSEIFRSALFGGIIGAIIFSIFGILLVNQSITFPGTERLASAGGFFIFTIAGGGALISALIASLVALFHRG